MSTEQYMSTGPDTATQDTGQSGLWAGDSGSLREPSRRALVQLLRGPYLSAASHGRLWTALLADEDAIRSRLSDMFLELVTDDAAQVAFVRNAGEDIDAPKVMRTATLTFLDTALLLHLRQQLLHETTGHLAIVGADEVADQLQVYREKDGADPAGFARRIKTSWQKMVKYGLLSATSTEGRYVVSPVLRLVFGPEEIAAVRHEYSRLAEGTLLVAEDDDETPLGGPGTAAAASPGDGGKAGSEESDGSEELDSSEELDDTEMLDSSEVLDSSAESEPAP